jgi:hypothetical protein
VTCTVVSYVPGNTPTGLQLNEPPGVIEAPLGGFVRLNVTLPLDDDADAWNVSGGFWFSATERSYGIGSRASDPDGVGSPPEEIGGGTGDGDATRSAVTIWAVLNEG